MFYLRQALRCRDLQLIQGLIVLRVGIMLIQHLVVITALIEEAKVML